MANGYYQLPITPFNPPDTGQDLQRMVQLRNLMANAPVQRQILQQQAEAGQQENQARQMQLQAGQQQAQDRQTVQQAMAQNPGKTYADILPQLRGKIRPDTWTALAETDQKISKGYSDQTEAELKTAQAQHGMYQQLYNSVMQMPDQQVLENWSAIAQQVDSIPGYKIPLDPSKPMSKAQLQQFGPFLSLNDAYLQNEMAKRKEKAGVETAETEAQLKAQQLKTAQAGGAMPGVPLETQEANAWLKKNPG